MAKTTNPEMTAEQLMAIPDDGNRHELVNGVPRTLSPAGFRHGQIAARLLSRIAAWAEKHDQGVALAAETGFLLRRRPDTVLAPDVSFVSRDRLAAFGDYEGYLPLAPDLVAEVVSPHDRPRDVEAKIQVWLSSGVKVVVKVNPQTLSVEAYRPGRPSETCTSGFVELGDVLPGLQLDVADLFA